MSSGFGEEGPQQVGSKMKRFYRQMKMYKSIRGR